MSLWRAPNGARLRIPRLPSMQAPPRTSSRRAPRSISSSDIAIVRAEMPPRRYAGRTVCPRQAHGGSFVAETRLCFWKWRPTQRWLGQEIGQLALRVLSLHSLRPALRPGAPAPSGRTSKPARCLHHPGRGGDGARVRVWCQNPAIAPALSPPVAAPPLLALQRPVLVAFRAGCAATRHHRRGRRRQRRPRQRHPGGAAGGSGQLKLLLCLLLGGNQTIWRCKLPSAAVTPSLPSQLSRLPLLPCRHPAGPPTASMEATRQR